MKFQYKIFVIICLMLFGHEQLFGQGEDCCGRYAVVSKCDVNDPMKENRYNDAYCISLKTNLAELMTEECFHFLNQKVVEDYKKTIQDPNEQLRIGSKAPEVHYTFEMNYISGLDEYNEEGRPVRSRLTVQMFFEGEQREFVHQWQTTGTWDTIKNSGTSWSGHRNKLGSSYKKGQDIDVIIDEFEKWPVECKVSPEIIDVNPGTAIEIVLSDFLDMYDEKSREFNRIVVHAFSGEIMNGESCKIGPDYKVFKIGDGTVTLNYKAPENCEEKEDKLKIYSACQILPIDKEPFEDTKIKEEINEKTINIICADAVLTLYKKVDKTVRINNEEDLPSGNCTTHTKKEQVLNQLTEARVTLELEKKEVMDMPLFNQTWEYFIPLTVNLSEFNFNSKEKKVDYSKSSGVGCAGGGYNSIDDITRSLQDFEIEGLQYIKQFPWIVVIDNETGKAVKFIPAGYDIVYGFIEKTVLNSTIYSSEGEKTETKISDKQFEKIFKFGPVGEEIPDPTIKKSDNWMGDYLKQQGIEMPAGIELPEVSNEESVKPVQPDILVKFGDGIKQFGGEGNHTIRKQLEHGFEEETLSYQWSMTKRIKK